MEQRLIDANALIKAMCSNCALFLDKTCDGNRISCYPSSIVREQPTVDAVPVVRCKDCKYAKDENFISAIWCENLEKYLAYDFFCHDGERKDTDKGDK